MKLCELGESIRRIVSYEEADLERKVLKVRLIVQIEKQGKAVNLHSWDYTANELKKGAI